MIVETAFAVAAIVLVVVGGRVRAGQQPPPSALDVDSNADTRRRSVTQPLGTALEVAAMACLVAAVITATLRHRDDVDVDHFAVSLIAVLVVAAILAVGRRRAARAAGGASTRR